MVLKPTRVLMTADTIGGVWSYAVELMRALAPYRCEFLLATFGARLTASQHQELATLPNVTLAESTYKLEWMPDPWRDVDASGAWLLEQAHAFRPDLVHLNTYAHGTLPWTVPVVMVGHSCVLSWWQAVKGVAAPRAWATYQQRVEASLLRAQMVVAPTRAMMTELNTYYGPLRARQVIYNARRAGDFSPRPMHQKANFIFTMGRVWDEAKNIAILDQIAGKLPWPIYVAGEARHPDGREVRLAHLHTLGRLSPAEVRDWLARASIFVLPARYEPFGLSVLEAALSGCALVLGDILSLREVWEDAALYVPPNDVTALQRCLTDLIHANPRRRRLAAAARKRAESYAPERMAYVYWTLYQNLIRQSASRHVLHKQATERRQAGELVQPLASPLHMEPPNAPISASGRSLH